MTVYILIHESYDGYRILGVYRDFGKAEIARQATIDIIVARAQRHKEAFRQDAEQSLVVEAWKVEGDD